MRPGSASRFARVVTRVALISALVVGVPAALWFAIGVPARLPSELELRTALSGTGDEFEQLLLYLLAGVVLVVWFQLVVAFGAAAVALRRGRRPRRPRLVATALHRLAVHLVSGLTVVSALAPTVADPVGAPVVAALIDDVARPFPALPAEPPSPGFVCPPAADAGLSTPSVELLVPEASIRTAVDEEDPVRHYVVRPGDDLWSIAARLARSEGPAANEEIARLWVELIETNRQQLYDPADPSLIHPGLRLVLPSAPVEDAPPVAAGVGDPRDPSSDDPETNGPPSGESEPPVLRPAEAGSGVENGPRSGGSDAPVLRPAEAGSGVGAGLGSGVEQPRSDAPVLRPPPVAREGGPATTDIATSGLGTVLAARFGPAGRAGDAAAGAAAAILGATVIGHLRRRGGRVRSGSGPEDVVAGPDGEVIAALEADAARTGAVDDVTAVLAGLRREAPGARVFGLAIADTITVLLRAPVDRAPHGVTVHDRGWSWLIGEPALERFRTAPRTTVDCALVSLGGHAIGGTLVIDLLSLGHLRLRGEIRDVEEVAAAMIVELAAAPVERSTAIHLVTDRELAGVTTHRSLAGLVEAAPAGVIVDLVSDDPATLDRLDALDGVAAVTANGRAGWVAEVAGDHVILEPLGVELARTRLPLAGCRSGSTDDSRHDGIDRLFRLAGLVPESSSPAPPIATMLEPSSPAPPIATVLEPSSAEQAEPEVAPVAPLFVEARDAASVPGDVRIKVLGVVEVVGSAGRFTSATALELVTYLAFHRDGADADRLERWVWPPDRPPGRRALVNAVWRVRRALGRGPDGEDLLARAGADGVYRLSERVTTDFEVASAAVAAANEATGVEAVELLRSALELVRGAPFGGGRFGWADHGVRAHVEYVLDEAAHRLADAALESGDVELARWSALQGLRVVPGCEQCYRRRLLVADATGNPTELRTVMAELRRIASDEGDEVGADLLELYDELRGSGITSVS